MDYQILTLKESAQMGDRDSQYELGCAYLLGEGCRRNRVLGMKWLILAAWDGDRDADFQLKLVGNDLREDQKKRALTMAVGWKFEKDKHKIIEQLVNSTVLFSEEGSGEDQGEGDLPVFVRVS